MKTYEYDEIFGLLEKMNRLDLKSQLMLNRSSDEIKRILAMPEWEKEKFKQLLTSNIWKKNYEEIKKILMMNEWKEEKFLPLLTSNIWKSNYKQIKNILAMPEWGKEKFLSLLTSTIWNSSYMNIKQKLNLPYWSENKYLQLLAPSIFSISKSNIENGILTLKQYGIDYYVTNKCLRYKTEFLKKLLEYLVKNDIKLIVLNTDNKDTLEYKLNPILNCEKGQLIKRFNIDPLVVERK